MRQLLFIHTDGCCSEFLNWAFCNSYDKLVQWRWFHRITWCVFIKGHSYTLCDAASRAMDRALHNVDYYYIITFWLFPGVECLITIVVPPRCPPCFLPPVLLCRVQCPSASTRSVLDHSRVLSTMNTKRYMFCVFRTSRVLFLSLSLEPVRTVLCVLRVARVVPHTVLGALDPVLRVICVMQGAKHTRRRKRRRRSTGKKTRARPSRKERRKRRGRSRKKKQSRRRRRRRNEKRRRRRTQRGSRGGSWWRTMLQRRCRRSRRS